MSELSTPHCSECNRPEYACGCEDRQNICVYCGVGLLDEELAVGREVCFACYCERND